MVKIDHVLVKYNSLHYCSSNGVLHVAIGDLVWKWQIFELFWLFLESCSLDPDYRPQYLSSVNFLRRKVVLFLKDGYILKWNLVYLYSWKNQETCLQVSFYGRVHILKTFMNFI